jgi:succinate-semialdehyde dehydrogenase/glutarate-semialdehyde dehydrogenase
MSAHDSTSRERIASINPATGDLLQSFAAHTDQEVERRLQLAAGAFARFRRTSLAERAALLDRAAQIMEQEKARLGRIMTLEMGKPLAAAIQEAEKCALACRYYAENGAHFLANELSSSTRSRSWVRYEPLGPVLAIMPWNFPFWQVTRFAAPALMAGNVGLLKHASNVPQCALAIEEVFSRAGFPTGSFQTLLIGSGRVNRIIEDSRVRAVTLTGSVGAGSQVASFAGRQVKKTVLELGGSDPFIVMPSAHLNDAVAVAVRARTINNGQSCIAAKRFIIHESIFDEFQERLVERMSALKVGDPMEPGTDIGPLATEHVAADLQEQVDKTVRMGAKLLLGRKRLEGRGFFFPPTVLTQIPKGSPAYQEELFGPVASLLRASRLEEAIEIANDTPFGLGASAWTNDAREQEEFIAELQAGLVFINGMVASDPSLPFGGIKQSGYGRELSHHGIREFVNIKTVVIKTGTEPGAHTE